KKTKELIANFSGIDKENRRWVAREVQDIDLRYYEKLLSGEANVKYFSVERPWTNEKIRTRLKMWEHRKGVSELAYVISYEYWNRGIGQSVLRKGFEKLDKQLQMIQKKFQCFEGDVLKKFYATARPINISSWHYCGQLESFIENLYKKQEIKVNKRYFMVNENDKIYTFSRGSE
ncbi:44052_t:CDS:2, partial [Gigaspora margarita]